MRAAHFYGRSDCASGRARAAPLSRHQGFPATAAPTLIFAACFRQPPRFQEAEILPPLVMMPRPPHVSGRCAAATSLFSFSAMPATLRAKARCRAHATATRITFGWAFSAGSMPFAAWQHHHRHSKLATILPPPPAAMTIIIFLARHAEMSAPRGRKIFLDDTASNSGIFAWRYDAPARQHDFTAAARKNAAPACRQHGREAPSARDIRYRSARHAALDITHTRDGQATPAFARRFTSSIDRPRRPAAQDMKMRLSPPSFFTLSPGEHILTMRVKRSADKAGHWRHI